MPLDDSVPCAKIAGPSLSVTVPVGIPVVLLTVMLKSTGLPASNEYAELTTDTVVGVMETLSLKAAERLLA